MHLSARGRSSVSRRRAAVRPALLLSGPVAAASSSQTLKRTALFDRHVDAGAKLVPFAGWEMPVQYGGIREEHVAVRDACGVFDVSHMGEIETSGPQAQELLQHLVSNDVEKLAVGGAQYAVMCREDGGVLDDLFTYRLAPDRFLTVTNAANHDNDLAWFQAHAGALRRRGVRRARALRDARRPGPAGARDRPGDGRRAAARALHDGAAHARRPRGARVRDRLHRRGRRRAAARPRRRAGALGRAAAPRRAQPAGLAARDTLRLEVCFHLYGNDLMQERGPIEAGLGWCCKEDTGLHRRRRRPRRPRGRAAREARALHADRAPASRARATRWSGAAR